MNIANIFGLHKNVPLKYGNTVVNEWWVVPFDGDESVSMIRPKYYRQYLISMWNIKDCKLLLKPLSALSEEDKAEFLKFYPHKKSISHFGIDGEDVFIVFIDSTDNLNYVPLSTSYCMWLCTKGYDVGIVPDEYKEIVE